MWQGGAFENLPTSPLHRLPPSSTAVSAPSSPSFQRRGLMVSSSHFWFAGVQKSSDWALAKMSVSMYVLALNANPKLRAKLSQNRWFSLVLCQSLVKLHQYFVKLHQHFVKNSSQPLSKCWLILAQDIKLQNDLKVGKLCKTVPRHPFLQQTNRVRAMFYVIWCHHSSNWL